MEFNFKLEIYVFITLITKQGRLLKSNMLILGVFFLLMTDPSGTNSQLVLALSTDAAPL